MLLLVAAFVVFAVADVTAVVAVVVIFVVVIVCCCCFYSIGGNKDLSSVITLPSRQEAWIFCLKNDMYFHYYRHYKEI